MGSLASAADRRFVIARLARLSSTSRARWGRLDAPRMLAHLGDQMRHALGGAGSAAHPATGLLRLKPVRFAMLYVLPLPKGVLGPEAAFRTPPRAWKDDLADLESLLDAFGSRGLGGPWPSHPRFGPMSGRDWAVFSYKHMDHHLSQFGG